MVNGGWTDGEKLMAKVWWIDDDHGDQWYMVMVAAVSYIWLRMIIKEPNVME